MIQALTKSEVRVDGCSCTCAASAHAAMRSFHGAPPWGPFAKVLAWALPKYCRDRLTFQEWDPVHHVDTSRPPVALVISSSELCAAGFKELSSSRQCSKPFDFSRNCWESSLSLWVGNLEKKVPKLRDDHLLEWIKRDLGDIYDKGVSVWWEPRTIRTRTTTGGCWSECTVYNSIHVSTQTFFVYYRG